MGRPARFDTLVERVRIGMTDLRRTPELLQPGCTSTWPFTGRSGYTLVTVTVEEHAVELRAGDVKTRVPLERVPKPFGGSQAWFRCPLCRHRRGMMFLGRSTWGCRLCLRLVYPSSREDRHDRLGRKLGKRLRRLGGARGDKPLSLPKPKRQRWKTYERLQAEAQRIDHELALELLGKIESRFGSLEELMARSRLT